MKKEGKKGAFLLLGIIILGSILFVSIGVQAFNFEDDLQQDVNVNIFQGNLTNLSQLGDTNIPSPSNNDVLTWNSATSKWIAQAVSIISRWLISPVTGGYIYNNSNTLFFNDTLNNATIDNRISIANISGGAGAQVLNQSNNQGYINWTRSVSADGKNVTLTARML